MDRIDYHCLLAGRGDLLELTKSAKFLIALLTCVMMVVPIYPSD